MTEREATDAAHGVANRAQIEMIVALNPYTEAPDNGRAYSYFPARSLRLFRHEIVIARIHPSRS